MRFVDLALLTRFLQPANSSSWRSSSLRSRHSVFGHEIRGQTELTPILTRLCDKGYCLLRPVWGELAQLSHFVTRLSVGEIANEPIGVSSVCPRSTPRRTLSKPISPFESKLYV